MAIIAVILFVAGMKDVLMSSSCRRKHCNKMCKNLSGEMRARPFLVTFLYNALLHTTCKLSRCHHFCTADRLEGKCDAQQMWLQPPIKQYKTLTKTLQGDHLNGQQALSQREDSITNEIHAFCDCYLKEYARSCKLTACCGGHAQEFNAPL